MPVETRAQRRKRELGPKKIEDLPLELESKKIEDLPVELEPKKIEDLPLELVEKLVGQLDAKDVLKLMMVNKKLYSRYAMNRWIIFGRHAAAVTFGQSSEPNNWIKKFVDSPPLELSATLVPCTKRINSCDELDLYLYDNVRREWDQPMCRKFLGQLKSVDQLWLGVGTEKSCLELLTNFCGSVKKIATLSIHGSLERDIERRTLLTKFIENHLNSCEKISLHGSFRNYVQFYLEAMMKTQIKRISIELCSGSFDGVVGWIVNEGIPSQNSEAVIRFALRYGYERDWIRARVGGEIRARVGDVFSEVQELQRVDDGKNLSALVLRANALLRENEDDDDYDDIDLFDENSSCFRRRIDSRTSCIYLFHASSGYARFLAFYMTSH